MIIHIFVKGQKDHAREKNRKNKYILAVDDDSDIVRLIEHALNRQGFKVCAFVDPIVALEYFNINRKDCILILSDIRMPGMNGYEFVKKAKEIDKQVKIVLMSAFEINEKEFHNLLPDIKIDGFLQKPFSLQKLNDVIGKISS